MEDEDDAGDNKLVCRLDNFSWLLASGHVKTEEILTYIRRPECDTVEKISNRCNSGGVW